MFKYNIISKLLILKGARKILLYLSFSNNSKLLNKYVFYILYFLINNIKIRYKLDVVNKYNYLINTFNNINGKFNLLPVSYLNYNNVYFFWYFFDQDNLIKIFINLLMRHGKKQVSYIHTYNTFFYLKKLTGMQPIILLKKFLLVHRFLFDIKNRISRYRETKLIKLLSINSQFTRSLKYIFNKFNINKFRINDRTTCFSKKLSLLILNTLFNKDIMNKIIKDDINYWLEDTRQLRVIESFRSYLTKTISLKKKKLWKVKYKTINKKMKFLKKNKNYVKRKIIKWVDDKNFFLLNRLNIHINTKFKLKNKWN